MSERDRGLVYRVKRAERQIGAQHANIDLLFDLLRDAVSSGARTDIQSAFDRLYGAVEAHFSLEDEVFFPALHGLHPNHEGELQALSREHERFVGEMGAIRSALRRPTLDAFERAVAEFRLAMGEHEAREERLISLLGASSSE